MPAAWTIRNGKASSKMTAKQTYEMARRFHSHPSIMSDIRHSRHDNCAVIDGALLERFFDRYETLRDSRRACFLIQNSCY
jgi:hypothetical protein